jgi:hypothetical protein
MGIRNSYLDDWARAASCSCAARVGWYGRCSTPAATDLESLRDVGKLSFIL